METIKVTVRPVAPAHEISIKIMEEKVLSTGTAKLIEIEDCVNQRLGSVPRLSEVEEYLRLIGLRGATKTELEEFFSDCQSEEELRVIGTGSYWRPDAWNGCRMVKEAGWDVYAFLNKSSLGIDGVRSIYAGRYYSPSGTFLAIVART